LDGYVHKYQVQDGVEIKSGGWPELATLKGYFEKGSSALAVATAKNGQNYLYIANSGYLGDQGDYQGHVTVINLQDGSQKVFNTLCSNNPQHFAEAPSTPNCPDVQSAIWARPGVIYDPDTDRIYMATGNGNYDPAKFDWGDSVFAINPDGSGANGRPLDSYTPANYPDLQATDTDLGSTAPAILQVPTNSKVKHLALQSGKDAIIRLINLDNLSGQGGPGHTGGEVWSGNVPQGGAVFSQPAAWVNPADGSTWTFITTGSGISGLKLAIDSTGNPSLQPVWIQQLSGTSPLVLKDVLFIASGSGITALDPLTGNTLWSDPQVAHFHWESPIVANGYLYISDEDSHLTGYTTAP
jgi:hypothetical protein